MILTKAQALAAKAVFDASTLRPDCRCYVTFNMSKAGAGLNVSDGPMASLHVVRQYDWTTVAEREVYISRNHFYVAYGIADHFYVAYEVAE